MTPGRQGEFRTLLRSNGPGNKAIFKHDSNFIVQPRFIKLVSKFLPVYKKRLIEQNNSSNTADFLHTHLQLQLKLFTRHIKIKNDNKNAKPKGAWLAINSCAIFGIQ